MFRRRAGDGAMRSWRVALPGLVAFACLLASVAVILIGRPDRVYSMSVILGVAAIGAGVLSVGERGNKLSVSAAFIVAVLAAAFLGPASAAIAAVIAELTATIMMRTKWQVVLYTNLPPAVMSAVASAV